jgi:hypothetical protein
MYVPIVNHVKNNIQCGLPISDNTEEDVSIDTILFIYAETFRKYRSLQRSMAQSSSDFFLFPEDWGSNSGQPT